MDELAEFAGFCAAHAITCVAEGEALVPMLVWELADGERKIQRFDESSLEEDAAAARLAFSQGAAGARAAVLCTDGYVTLETGRTDAILVKAVSYERASRILEALVPYRHADRGFAVHRVKFMDFPGTRAALVSAVAAFQRGIDRHADGAAVWNAAYDESV